MEFALLAVVTALIKKIVDMVKYLTAQDVNAVITQLVAWVAGIIVVYIGAKSDWASTVLIGDKPLDTLSNWSLVLVGLNLSSLAGLTWDAIKAFDNSGSASVPTLLPPHDRADSTTV